jgi:hypothetical protein
VFPCAPRSKAPLLRNPHPPGSPQRRTCVGYRDCGRLGHGVLDATTDRHLITGEMWGRHPRANIGIACGAPGPDVIDVDTAHGKPGLATLERLREAGLLHGVRALVATPSGGRHLYFAGGGTGQGNGADARHGIDFRSSGGYVLAPPSVTAAGGYTVVEWHPESGVEVDFAAIRRFLTPRVPRSGRRERDTDFAALVRWVGEQREGNRNNGLFWAACRAVEHGAPDEVLAGLVDAAVDTGLPYDEAERTVESARTRLDDAG